MKLCLGVDAGGTKTHAMLVTPAGEIVGFGVGGCGNWEGVGVDGAYATLSQAIGDALEQAGGRPGQIVSAALGLAGDDWPSDEPRLRPLVARLGLPRDTPILNDSFIALRAGTPDPFGVAALSGTGTVTAGRNRQGQTFRSFGAGMFLGEWGGGSEIYLEAVRSIARAYLGLAPATLLRERLLAQSGAPNELELFEGISRHTLKILPNARIVIETAAEGDQVAQSILRQAGASLAETASAIARKLDMQQEPFDLVMGGGVFQATYPLMRESFIAEAGRLLPQARPVQLTVRPVAGAVMLALEQRGWLDRDGWQRLHDAAQRFE